MCYEEVNALSLFKFDFSGIVYDEYTVSCASLIDRMEIRTSTDVNYILKYDGVYISDDYALFCPIEEIPEVPENPYVGMHGELIASTLLGPYSKTATNTQKYPGEPPAKKHECTLYYWIDDGRCTYIARVQNDICRVISVEEDPAGSYFGN